MGRHTYLAILLIWGGIVLIINPSIPSEGEERMYDLNSIENVQSFDLNDKTKGMLEKNGFAVVPTTLEQIYEIYNDCREKSQPILVTADVVLHTYHVLFDNILRILEITEFKEEIGDLTETMLLTSTEQHRSVKETKVKEAVMKNIAYFGVASRLLGVEADIPAAVKGLIDEEIKLINEHRGFATSPIFGYKEDYSQYIPRGHYTRSEEFVRLFKAMMWYGRMMFRLRPGESPEEVAKGQEETRQALLIVSALENAGMGEKKALAVWERIYNTLSFFVGKTDDLDFYDFTKIAQEIYETAPPLDAFADDAKLNTFISRARALRKPKILSSYRIGFEKGEESFAQGFRFMGQRFIPDSYIFQELVYDKVGSPNNPRLFPKALDIMAILGSRRAEQILREQGEYQYRNYEEQLNMLKEEFGLVKPKEWTQNLYYGWLFSLKALLTESEEGRPPFMEGQVWTGRELTTALASWTELRHDTILYAKQAYGEIGMAPIPQPTKGYVEPYPLLYARLAELSRQIRTNLDSQGLLIGEVREKLIKFEELTRRLKVISEKELASEPLTDDEYETIRNIGRILKGLTHFSPQITPLITSGTDEKMAVVADVYTASKVGQVLQEAVGSPFIIYAIVEVEGTTQIVKGGVLSHYEFRQPMGDRLTDEEWQEMIKAKKQPPLADWTADFVAR